MHVEKSRSGRGKALRLGAAAVLGAVAVLTAASPGWAVNTPDVATVSQATGPSGGGNSLIVNVASTTVGQEFVQGSTSVMFMVDATSTCPTTLPALGATKVLVAPADVRVIATNRLAVNVPAGVVLTAGGGTPTTLLWDLCVYHTGTAGADIDATKNDAYTIGVVPTITSISPTTGPAQGGTAVTITGTNLGTATAAIDGVQLGSQTPSSTTITGTTVAHTAGGPLGVTVAVSGGGTRTLTSGFTFTNGITSAPTTTPNTKSKVSLDVKGIGYNAMNFSTTTGTTPDDTNAHVYLSKNAYDPTKNGAWKTAGQAAECLNVLVIADTELVCSLYPSGGGIPMNARAVTGTVSGTTFTATTGSFTQGDVGAGVTGSSNIATGVIITGLTDATHAILSKAASPSITSATALNLVVNRNFTDATWTNTDKSLISAGNANFGPYDVGKVVTGTGIQAGTTITSVTDAKTAVLSAIPSTASSAGAGSATIAYTAPPGPIPNGTYTVTVVNNGSVDAQKTDAYTTSIITSGSTFTVADY